MLTLDGMGRPDPDYKRASASPPSDTVEISSPVLGNRVPTLLLLSMFAIAARYRPTSDTPLPSTDGDMWGAGDEYLEHAKRMLSAFSPLQK